MNHFRPPLSTRRQFLAGAAGVAGATLLSSCSLWPESSDPEPGHGQADVVYGVVPHLVSSRGLAGVTDRLDDLSDLGITMLWLPPPTVTPTGDFGYDVVDFRSLRGDYGTNEDMHSFVAAAHDRGMRVVMDFVANHSSRRHRWLRAEEGEPRYDFYDRAAGGRPRHYFDWNHLPNLALANPEVANYMIGSLVYWVDEFDIDGFRLDVAWGPAERAPDFWPKALRALRARKRVFLLAEASVRDPYYSRAGFDAAYDWTKDLGHWAWQDIFDESFADAGGLADAVEKSLQQAPSGDGVFRFINNNDTGERFITQHGPAMTRLAAAFLLTIPGIPCIYEGDEVGAEYEPYVDIDPIDMTDRHGLLEHYKELVDVRRSVAALSSSAMRRIETEDPNVLVLEREHPDGNVTLVFNFLDGESSASISAERIIYHLRDPSSVGDSVDSQLDLAGLDCVILET